MNKIKYTTNDGFLRDVPVFNRRIIDKMPQILAQAYIPISIKEIMEQRVIAWASNNIELAEQWGKNYFDSGDSIMYHRDGRIKFVPDSQTLLSVNKNTKLRWCGAQVLSERDFNNADGEIFSKEEVNKFTNQYLNPEKVLENPIWLAFARGDKILLKEYVNQVSSRIVDLELMKIWICDTPNFEAERPCSLNGLYFNSNAGAYYSDSLDINTSRLVGVVPKIEKLKKITPFKKKLDLEMAMEDY